MLTRSKSPETLQPSSLRYALYLVLVGACAARQSIPSLPPDHDVAGVDTVLLALRDYSNTVTISTRFPTADDPIGNFLVITAIAFDNSTNIRMTRDDVCSHPEVRCFVNNGFADEVCVSTTRRPSIHIRHMSSPDYYVTSCPVRPNGVFSCEYRQGETFVCVSGRVLLNNSMPLDHPYGYKVCYLGCDQLIFYLW